MPAGLPTPIEQSRSKPSIRARTGCYTCRIGREKCDDKMSNNGSCHTCERLRLQYLGFGANRPDWMREGNSIQEMREKIKTFLAQNGMIKGDPGTANLHSVGHSTSSQGVFTGATPPAHGPNGLTLASAMPVVAPDGRSSSPSNPPKILIPRSQVIKLPSHRNGQNGLFRHYPTEKLRVFTTHALLHWVDRFGYLLHMHFCIGLIADNDYQILREKIEHTKRNYDHIGPKAEKLHSRACSLRASYESSGDVGDLEGAIKLHRAALQHESFLRMGHEDRTLIFRDLSKCLRMHFGHSGRVEYLSEAISLECFEQERLFGRSGESDIGEAIAMQRVSHDPPYDPSKDATTKPWLKERTSHSTSSGSLARRLFKRFNHTGRTNDLKKAISLQRSALKRRADEHSCLPTSMGNLATMLLACFNHSGKIENLEEAISLGRAALLLRPEGHPNRPASLGNLSNSLWTRFNYRGERKDLEEAVSLGRAALGLRSKRDPGRSASLGNLSRSLWTRFNHGGRIQDLHEAISLQRKALRLRPEGHPGRSWSLGNLATFLRTRFNRKGRMKDLAEAIRLERVALALRPEGNPSRPALLSNLANSLWTRFSHGGKRGDLEEAISLEFAALELQPDDHPSRSRSLNNLAVLLWTRSNYGEKLQDLDDAISLERAALELRPEGHPGRSWSLYYLAEFLYLRSRKRGCTDDLEEAVMSFSRSAFHPFSSFAIRLDSVHRWTTIARSHNHSTLIKAHKASMSLLQRALVTRPTLSEQHRLLCGDGRHQTLALDAASDAINNGELTSAIEFLEQGRTLLWSQMRGFRTPLEELSEVDETLAERFRDCNRRLEGLATWSESYSTGSGANAFESSASQGPQSMDEMLEQMRRLSEDQEAIIDDIRRKPGFENFLEASPFSALQHSASEGPIVVINHSKYRCDALIVLARETEPCICVPLDSGFYALSIELHDQLLRTRDSPGVDSDEYDKVLQGLLKILWDRVVSKVVQRLKEIGINEGSRIWWCPTSVLSAFPFHAAGPYKGPDGREKYLLDDYISSYTPTLALLINARSGAQNSGKRMLFVGDTKLPSVRKELRTIAGIRRFKDLLGRRATRQAVLRLLQEAHWVHFACHGTLGEEPFISSLKLSNGGLSLLDIARANLPNAEFAFLLACHTAEQRSDFALDEALHLAAGIHFCGFRSVVGTMWQLLDHDGPLLAGVVYKYLMRDLDEDEIRFKRAAAAVRLAALNLRDHGDVDPRTGKLMTERWVNLVHIGA